MKISELGTMAAVVREGDYLVFRSNQSGIHVEYSPSASPGSPVIGAFASRRGRLRYMEAAEAADLVQNFSIAAEEQLVRSLELSGAPKNQKLSDKLLSALRSYADAGYRETSERPVWDGRLSEFHREILYPALGVPYSPAIVRALQAVAKRVPGITVAKVAREHFLTVEWGALTQ